MQSGFNLERFIATWQVYRNFSRCGMVSVQSSLLLKMSDWYLSITGTRVKEETPIEISECVRWRTRSMNNLEKLTEGKPLCMLLTQERMPENFSCNRGSTNELNKLYYRCSFFHRIDWNWKRIEISIGSLEIASILNNQRTEGKGNFQEMVSAQCISRWQTEPTWCQILKSKEVCCEALKKLMLCLGATGAYICESQG